MFVFNEIGVVESILCVDVVDGVFVFVVNLLNFFIINFIYDVVFVKCVRLIICEVGEIVLVDVLCYMFVY